MAKLAVCVSAVLLLLVALSETVYQGPCCTKNYDKPIALQKLKSFTVQNDTQICNIKSIIFFTVKDKLVCTNPEMPWVIRAMKHLKKKQQTGSQRVGEDQLKA
ncbi:C-C motif chemokine 13 [Xiphophorus couchianus]|uniref:C-C motif chemokine 13 n=1 Tax=Xiphophorus couchianus TaxID=32473 RepID=UPI0010169872|nr:C-C motif chemokine 13-like [Xiphophorus couchianus]